MTFGIDNAADVQTSRHELAPLTDAQRATVDALALYVAAASRVPVDVAAVPSTFERGAVLVLVTPDGGPAPDYVTAVYMADGTRRAVRGESDYADLVGALALIGNVGDYAVRREGTSAYVVRAGGSYLTEAVAEAAAARVRLETSDASARERRAERRRLYGAVPSDALADMRTISYIPAGAAEHERELITVRAADIAEAARGIVARGGSDLLIGDAGAFNVDGTLKADA